jgi:hypothetical protein
VDATKKEIKMYADLASFIFMEKQELLEQGMPLPIADRLAVENIIEAFAFGITPDAMKTAMTWISN